MYRIKADGILNIKPIEKEEAVEEHFIDVSLWGILYVIRLIRRLFRLLSAFDGNLSPTIAL